MTYTIDSTIKFAQELIEIPTQGGIDSCTPALELIQSRLADRGLPSRFLYSSDATPVGVVCDINGIRSGPLYCLTACVDTAPFGDVETWKFSPTSARIENGWLYGRGSADSKVAVAIFSDIAVMLRDKLDEIAGTVSFYFDGDEHTGAFRGIKAYTKEHPKADGVFIGYPGNEAVCSGCRGFYRVQLTTYGEAMHSGTFKPSGGNAIVKAALLITRLNELQLNKKVDKAFGLGPKLSVTGVGGGTGYSIIPDKCDVRVDVRLTPIFDVENVSKAILEVAAQVDREYPTRRPTKIVEEEGWPAYKLREDSPVLTALLNSAQKHFRKPIGYRICGPSNVGNYLASMGIEATCGFGLSYKNVHGPDERIDISTIEPTYKVYLDAIKSLVFHNKADWELLSTRANLA